MILRRILAGLGGLVYAAAYGFWTMFATGGGHANFVWLFLFVFVYLFGIYFPLMAVLAVDLRSRIVKIIFGSLIVYSLLGSVLLLGAWITDATEGSLDDFNKMWTWYRETVLVCGAIHFLPIIFFSVLLIVAIFKRGSSDDSSASLGLS